MGDLRKREYLEEEAWTGEPVQEVLKGLLGGRSALKEINRVSGDDKQTAKLAREVYMELSRRLRKVMDDEFVQTANILRNASKQRDPASMRNMVFKAANRIGKKLPSSSF